MNTQGKPENLTPFRPGQSGNPGGRPRKRLISDCYADRAQMPLDESLRRELKLPKGLTYAEAIALRLARAAVEGSPGAAREFREAVEGRSRQRVETEENSLARAFPEMTNEELEAYAKDGAVPSWFPKSQDNSNGA